MQLELQASGIDENGRELSAHALAHSNARRDEMRRRRDVLPPARQAALAQLTAALQAPTADALSTALAAARLAALEGDGAVDMVSGAKGGRWMVLDCPPN
jgi:vacuolar-type H+-ATPase subunit E/Vma4